MSVPLIGESSQSPSKKRKHGELLPDGTKTPRKKSKTDTSKKSHKKKSKDEDSQFRVVDASIMLSIPPVFADDPMIGAKEMLDSLIMRYVAALGGVLLCHANVQFLTSTAAIKNECPFLVCNVGFQATVWSPQVGSKMTGTVNICSPDHLSLLMHQTFNVSIPRHHIPENWEFEHGAAENDPEFQPAEVSYDADGEPITTAEQGGVWVHSLTGAKIGGDDGRVEFTVIGLTVANQMLSLIGSLQPDPFSPEHVPKSAVAVVAENEAEEDVEATAPLPELSDDEYENDPFESLSRAKQDAMERQAALDTTNDDTVEQISVDKEEEKRRKKREKRARKEKKKAEKAAANGQPVDQNPPAEKPKKKRKKDVQEG